MSELAIVKEAIEEAGIDQLSNIGIDEVDDDFMVAAVVGLTDGGIKVLHEDYTGEKADLYGELSYSEGTVAKAMAAAAIKSSFAPGPMYDFQELAVQYFLDPRSTFADFEPRSNISIAPGHMLIDDNIVLLPQPPKAVVEYGACLYSGNRLEDQIGFLNYNQKPFFYSPITRMHFTNKTLMYMYERKFGEGTAEIMIDNKRYIGREDGVAAATDEMISLNRLHGMPTEVVDIILSVGTQHTTAAELEHGIRNAHTLLKMGGILVARALTEPGPDDIGIEDITAWASDSGFSKKNSIWLEGVELPTGAQIEHGQFGDQAVQSVILQKV